MWSAFLLTVGTHTIGKSQNSILTLAIGSCSLITKENLPHHWQMLRFRSLSWEPKGLKQKNKNTKKTNLPKQHTSLHARLPMGRGWERVNRMWQMLGPLLYALLEGSQVLWWWAQYKILYRREHHQKDKNNTQCIANRQKNFRGSKKSLESQDQESSY